MSAKSWNEKRTLRFHNGRLVVWPGSVQRWIAEDRNGEMVVNGVPEIGHVTPTRLEYGTAMRAIREMPAAYQNALLNGMPVVVVERELPEFVRRLA